MREGITLACPECKRRNYRTNKNKFQQYDIAPYSEGWIMADMGLFPF